MNTLTFFAYSYRLFWSCFSVFGFVAALLGIVGGIMGRTALGSAIVREEEEEDRGGQRSLRWREERNRRSDDLRKAWRRHHPSEQKKFRKGRPKKRPLS